MPLAKLTSRRAAIARRALVLPFLLMTLGAGVATAQPSTITMIVGAGAGTGFDVYARVLARHMPRHLPGNPNMVVQNMPGAGSVKAADYIFTQAPKDGSVIGILFPGALMEPLIGKPSDYRYDPRKFSHLGTADTGTRLCMTFKTSKVKTMEDAQKMPAVIAATQRGSSTSDYPLMMNAFAGTKFKVVSGYPSTGDIVLAMERGEADGVCGHELSSVKSQRPGWIGSPDVNVLVQVGVDKNDELDALGVPLLSKFVPPENKAVVDLLVSQQAFGRPFVAPPDVPTAQLKVLRTAFLASFADPELLAEAKKAGLEVNTKSGEEVAAVVDKMYGSPKELAERILAAIRQ